MRSKELDDTSADARRILTQRYAEMTPAEKLQRVRDLTRTVATLALAGLRARHSGETDSELMVRLACMRLGDAAVSRAYPNRATGHGA